jgi:DNA-binding transcriptional regulator YbjK
MNTETNLITLLETVILSQMLMENLEQLQSTHYNKSNLKVKIKTLLKEITPLAEKDFNTVFENGEHETQSIVMEYEKLVSFIANQNLPQKVVLSQMVEAFNLDQKTIEATVHRIIKKHAK